MWIGRKEKKEDSKDSPYAGLPLDDEGFPQAEVIKEKFEEVMGEGVDQEDVNRSLDIQRRAVKLAKEMTRNEIREAFLAHWTAVTLKSHCKKCLEEELKIMGNIISQTPVDAIMTEQKAHDVPHGEDNDGKDD